MWTAGRPDVLRDQVDRALRRLRADRLALLQLHRIEPEVPLADQVGTLGGLQDAGKIGHIGLSEVTVTELDRARPGAADRGHRQCAEPLHVLDREHDAVLDACTTAGIAFLPWRPVHPAASEPAGEFARQCA